MLFVKRHWDSSEILGGLAEKIGEFWIFHSVFNPFFYWKNYQLEIKKNQNIFKFEK